MRAIAQLEQAGWSVLFHRDRRERPKEEAYAQEQPQMNTEETPDAVLAFLRSSFDPLTGCLPTQAQLASQIALGEVVAQREDGEIVGVLHFEKGRASSEIRHLAVREDRRGKQDTADRDREKGSDAGTGSCTCTGSEHTCGGSGSGRYRTSDCAWYGDCDV